MRRRTVQRRPLRQLAPRQRGAAAVHYPPLLEDDASMPHAYRSSAHPCLLAWSYRLAHKGASVPSSPSTPAVRGPANNKPALSAEVAQAARRPRVTNHPIARPCRSLFGVAPGVSRPVSANDRPQERPAKLSGRLPRVRGARSRRISISEAMYLRIRWRWPQMPPCCCRRRRLLAPHLGVIGRTATRNSHSSQGC